jgi:hypothetical protein
MTTLQTVTIIISFGLFSCNNNRTKEIVNNKNVVLNSPSIDTLALKSEQHSGISFSDTIKRFEVDDYLITFEMMRKQSVDNYSSYSKTSGKTHSIDKAWFTNDTIKQTLIFELYTDGHRIVTYHFFNNDIPSNIIERIELHTFDGQLANKQQKLKDFKGFINQSTKIDSKFFTSKKGLKLGDNKSKALAIYGQPDKETANNGVEKLEWNFVGEILYDGKENLKGKPLAKDNYGHQAYLLFKNGKLVGQILHNDIP